VDEWDSPERLARAEELHNEAEEADKIEKRSKQELLAQQYKEWQLEKEYRKLKYAAQDAWDEYSAFKDDAVLFKDFVEQHPGMEHKAGVNSGGTFVTVAEDSGEKR
jgi:hypothetical protein